MLTFVSRRLASMVPILIVVSILIFLFLHLIPGDPARIVAGPEASLQDVQNVRSSLHLDLPLYQQYFLFLIHAVQGNFGFSYRTHQTVSSLLGDRFGPTLELAVVSMVWAMVAGLIGGVVAAVKRGKWQDQLAMLVSVTGFSMPTFWFGLMLIELFAVQLGWLPSGGSGSFAHVILPAITLGSGVAAVIARFTRSSLLETLREDYVRTARAKGAKESRVIWLHALRNALIPVVTMTGLQFGFLLGGSVVVEAVFSWPGMGRLLIDAVSFRDYPVIQAEMLLFALEFMLINLLVDVLYASLNPQIRLQ